VSIEWDSLISGGTSCRLLVQRPRTLLERTQYGRSAGTAKGRRRRASVWPALRRPTYHGVMAAWTSSAPCGSACTATYNDVIGFGGRLCGGTTPGKL